MRERLDLPFELHVAPGRGASARLHHLLRQAILEGRLAAGFRLPPTREIAQALGIARATAVVAYDMLVAEDYARVRQGDGTFVQSMRRASRRDEIASPCRGSSIANKGSPRFDLRLGLPDVSLFPFDAWRRAESRAWRVLARDANAIPDPAGPARLREAIVGHASQTRAVSCTADDVVVTAGARQAFDLLARTLITRSGTVVAVEDPGFTPLRRAFAQAGAEIVGITVDEDGMDVSQIPPETEVVCVTPSHQFPLGVTMSAARRALLLDRAGRSGMHVVEDDYDCEYRYDGRPLDALQTLAPGSVCYVGTFSKTMFPALRLGYAIVPRALRGRLLDIRMGVDGFGAPAPQAALAEFIAEGQLRRHVRRMQRIYARRRTGLLEGLRSRLQDRISVLPSNAGLHFSFRPEAFLDWGVVEDRASHLGVAFERCSRYAVGVSPDACAIGFGLLKDDQVEAVVDRLARIFG